MSHNQVTAKFDFATIFDCGSFEVSKGQKFVLSIKNCAGRLKWFADHDEVLQIKESPDSHSATITALETGISRLEIQQRKSILRILRIKVTSANATGFSVVVDKPELKKKPTP